MAFDDLRVGALARAVRHRLGWRQSDLARRVGVSQKLVSLFESGRLDEMTVRSARRVANGLEIRLMFAPRWRGGDGVRLLDADHAGLGNAVVARLMGRGWDVVVEYTFNHYGERGSVDVVAWQPEARAILVVEVKTRILDTQEMIASLGRKARVVPPLLRRERGWTFESVGSVLAVAELTANRSVAARHRATFNAAFPARNWAVHRWIAQPKGPMSGLWFLRSSNGASGTRSIGGRKRVRHGRPRSA